jgi:pimeloyl-ACP methyl ester carboxylesterase
VVACARLERPCWRAQALGRRAAALHALADRLSRIEARLVRLNPIACSRRRLPPLLWAVAAVAAVAAVVTPAAVAAPLATATSPAAGSAIAPTPLTVGRLTLKWCAASGSWCATLPRPLDPTGAVPGTVPIYFEYYPHSAPGPSAGTLVAAEGGPGYPTTDSRDSYLALFAPLRTTRDVLLMDYRGTGRSGAVDCRELQNAAALTEANIGACGASLGARAPLYSTTLASDDLAALLAALGITRIDLYGDSYGSYFAQVFALRHAERVRSLVLDGADALDGPDYPWFPHYAPAMRDKFNLACQRAPECARLGGDSLQHIAPALARLRAQPFAARVRAAGGQLLDFSADAAQLAIVMFGGSPAYATVREVDAAARAFTAGDSLPLLRLMAETLGSVDSRDPSRSPQKFSAGLAAAVSCLDPPQIFDMTLPPPQRVAQRDVLMAQRRQAVPATYAPFSIDEYRHMPLDYAFIDQCVRWPAAPAAPLVGGALHYPDVPVLVLSGELDDMTSVADGAVVAGHYPHAHHVIIANSFHVNALPHARSECGALLVRHFIEQLSPGDAGCAAAVPPVRLVPRFARRADELPPAHAEPGNDATVDELRVVSAVLQSCADAIVRAAENGAGTGLGLRGGTFAAEEAGVGGYRLMLHDVRWTQDVGVSGRLDWPGRSGAVHASVQLAGADSGTLELEWAEGVARARATVRGRLNAHAVVASAPAP